MRWLAEQLGFPVFAGLAVGVPLVTYGVWLATRLM